MSNYLAKEFREVHDFSPDMKQNLQGSYCPKLQMRRGPQAITGSHSLSPLCHNRDTLITVIKQPIQPRHISPRHCLPAIPHRMRQPPSKYTHLHMGHKARDGS